MHAGILGFRTALAIFGLLLLSACKIEFDVPVGGRVEVLDYDVFYTFCSEDSHCFLEVSNFDSIRTFFAEPNEGYVFVEWDKGDRYLFGGETGAVSIYSSRAVDNPDVEYIVSSDETFYMRPVFALENFDTNPRGVPSLYQVDCNECDGVQVLDWPVSLDYKRDLNLWGYTGRSERETTLGIFILYANEYDYMVENLTALDDYGEGLARFVGLREGQVVRKGEQVIFSLVTSAPDPFAEPSLGILTIIYEFGFDIAGTEASFGTTITSVVGDRCPVC